MSKHEFRVKYLMRGSYQELKLALALTTLSGAGFAACAAIPGADEAASAAKLVGGMTAQELLALVCVLSMGLTWYCVKTMVKQNAAAATALVEIAAKMRNMKCIRELEGRE